MYGKVFASMFTGSMYGCGAPAFAVMSYVIANQKPDRETGFQVELNVKDLANRIGESEEVISKAIDFLCAPDAKSRTEGEEGRRLIRLGTFEYQVVNGRHYDDLKRAEDQRAANRARQTKFRSKQVYSSRRKRKKKSADHPLGGEPEYVEAERNGAGERELDRIVAEHLPKP